MTQVLHYIEKFKWAIFGTVIVHVAVFVISMLSTVKRPLIIEEPVVRTTLEMPEELELDEFEVQNQVIDPETGEVINASRDLNDNRKPSENFSYSAADQDAMSRTLDYEKSVMDALKANHKPEDNRNLYTDDKGVDTGDDKQVKKDGGNNAAPIGRTLVSFSLKGRKAHALPKPGYLCPGSGKVTMRIKVDKSGKVIEANPIPSECSNATQCMYQVAAEYARKSRFDYKGDMGNQEGKIIYTFVGQ